MGCDYLSLPEIPVSGTKVPIYSRKCIPNFACQFLFIQTEFWNQFLECKCLFLISFNRNMLLEVLVHSELLLEHNVNQGVLCIIASPISAKSLLRLRAWISNCIHAKQWFIITYPFSYFNGSSVKQCRGKAMEMSQLISWWRHQMETFSMPLGLVNSLHKSWWCGALLFCLICVWKKGRVNNREAGDLRCYHAHYDVTVMFP